MQSINVCTDTFIRSHGTSPKGRGGWGFIVMDGRAEVETFFVPGCMTFADAKVWAKAYTRENFPGCVELQVAP